MVSAVTPVSEAEFLPLELPPPPPLLPPQAASVVATVAAARAVTRRREDLDNGSPLVRPGRGCPGVCGGRAGRSRRSDRVVLTPRRGRSGGRRRCRRGRRRRTWPASPGRPATA